MCRMLWEQRSSMLAQVPTDLKDLAQQCYCDLQMVQVVAFGKRPNRPPPPFFVVDFRVSISVPNRQLTLTSASRPAVVRTSRRPCCSPPWSLRLRGACYGRDGFYQCASVGEGGGRIGIEVAGRDRGSISRAGEESFDFFRCLGSDGRDQVLLAEELTVGCAVLQRAGCKVPWRGG